MKKIIAQGRLLLLTCYLVQSVTAQAMDRISVFVSIPPQKYLVERIGGDHVQVDVMLAPAQSTETYEPSPKQLAKLASANIYFQICVPFERVLSDVIQEINRSLKIVECSELMLDRDPGGQSRDHIDDQQIRDPHVWASPLKAKEIAKQILRELTASEPRSGEYFSANYDSLIVDLDALDARIRDRLKAVKSRYLIVSHPSLGYYTDAYGFKQIAIEQKGKEIQGKALVELIQFARREKIHTVLVQKQFRHASAEILARELDAMVIEFDPFAENYIENLDFLTAEIVRGSL